MPFAGSAHQIRLRVLLPSARPGLSLQRRLLHRGPADAGRSEGVADVEHPQLITHFDDVRVGLIDGVEAVGCQGHDLFVQGTLPLHSVFAAGVAEAVALASHLVDAQPTSSVLAERPRCGKADPLY